MDWPTRSDEIQARFFRTGPKTYLWLDYGTLSRDLLQWSFTFMDLGMRHTLSGHARVLQAESGEYVVNGRGHASENDALESVFGRHYLDFVDRLYRDMLADL